MFIEKKFLLGMYLLIAVFCAQSLYAKIVYDPTNHIENAATAANTASVLVNQATQIKHQLEMIQFQTKNAKSMSQVDWGNLNSLIHELDNNAQKGQALSQSMSALETQFKKRYPDYANQKNNPTNYNKAYHSWSEGTLSSFQNLLKAGGFAVSAFDGEQRLMNVLNAKSKGAQGNLQVLQVSSAIASENVNQLRSLKRLIVAQNQAQSAYMSYQVSKESYKERNIEDIAKNIKTDFPKYKNNPNFGKIQPIN